MQNGQKNPLDPQRIKSKQGGQANFNFKTYIIFNLLNTFLRVSVGKFATSRICNCRFNLHSTYFRPATDVYDNIADELKFVGTKVACNSTKDIVYFADGLKISYHAK